MWRHATHYPGEVHCVTSREELSGSAVCYWRVRIPAASGSSEVFSLSSKSRQEIKARQRPTFPLPLPPHSRANLNVDARFAAGLSISLRRLVLARDWRGAGGRGGRGFTIANGRRIRLQCFCPNSIICVCLRLSASSLGWEAPLIFLSLSGGLVFRKRRWIHKTGFSFPPFLAPAVGRAGISI